MHLKTGYILNNGKYEILDLLGQGGFGITYKAAGKTTFKGELGSIDASVQVAIKEFFFKDYCERERDTMRVTFSSATGKELFQQFKEKLVKEAIILSKLNYPNIIRVIEIFEENNTAYLVMEFVEGNSLLDILNEQGTIPVIQAIDYTSQIGDALSYVHTQNILHLDVKPSNILLRKKDDRALLIDFGVSKRYSIEHKETSITPVGRSKGYAPLEQYSDTGTATFSPSLDVYSLGATLYHCITGVMPSEPFEIVENGIVPPSVLNPVIPIQLEQVILKAMALKKSDRFQTVEEFIQAIKDTGKSKQEPSHIKPAVVILSEPNDSGETLPGYFVPDNILPDPSNFVESLEIKFPESGYTTGTMEIKMVYIQGGSFQIGSNDSHADEKPVHTVTVGSYYIGKYEVTQKQWREVMGNDPSELYNKGCDNCPVERVSWNDVQEFIRKLNEKSGKKYRLPTEAEWEYAARGGIKSKGYKYAGSNTIGKVAWYTGNSSNTKSVGQRAPNELGIYDMSGNVWEWCADWYANDYYANSPKNNPKNTTPGSYRVCRGGSWRSPPSCCCLAYRDRWGPDYRGYDLGFRLVRIE